MARLVILESPYRGDDGHANLERNRNYARECMRDSIINHGESPFASHLLYTQEGVLDDTIPEERALGIEIGLAWGEHANATIVYTDFGITEGMRLGIERAKEVGRPVELRTLRKRG